MKTMTAFGPFEKPSSELGFEQVQLFLITSSCIGCLPGPDPCEELSLAWNKHSTRCCNGKLSAAVIMILSQSDQGTATSRISPAEFSRFPNFPHSF